MNISSHYRAVFFAVAIALMCSSSVFAGGLARMALESGGETVVGITTTEGDSEKLKAGGFVHLELGYLGRLLGSDPSWETEGTAGYKSDKVKFKNGDMSFTRFTLNLMQYYRLGSILRVGAGLTYHLKGNAKADIPQISVSGDADFDNSLGFMVAADYTISELLNVGVRFTWIDYELSDNSIAEPFEGNSAGGYVSFNF